MGDEEIETDRERVGGREREMVRERERGRVREVMMLNFHFGKSVDRQNVLCWPL